ncbi:MAG TPA: J domain-containing protein [Candidatus Acidoferrum sp.]|nr:J domain-containing protein [Candidatus Acidoferrum sp.]
MTVARAYETLGLDGARASADDVRARFRDLIFANHPDRAPLERQARANETTRELVEAYTFLRERGYPRVQSVARVSTAPEWSYEPQEQPEQTPSDPFAWVEEVWHENVARGRPEDAVTAAFVRAMWPSLGALAFLALGLAVLAAALLAGEWIAVGLALVWIAFGIRLGASARRIGADVLRFWRVWARLAEPAVLERARRKLLLRLALMLAIAAAAVAVIRRL